MSLLSKTTRLLYIMLAFFEHFSEAKALSIIHAFWWHFPRKINFFRENKIEINFFQEPMPHELLLF